MSRRTVKLPIPALVAALVVALAGCDSPPPAPPEAAASASAAAAPLGGVIPPSTVEQPLAQPTASAEVEPEIVAAQHVLVAYKGSKGAPKGITRSKEEAKKRAEEALSRVRKGDDFTEVVKAYSDEPGAADRLGSLGKFKREAMVKPFADAAFALEVGQVSEVVESDFGFHVIRRNQ